MWMLFSDIIWLCKVARTTMAFKELEDKLNANVHNGDPRIQFVFYRGRGDTLPRGYGGSITKVWQAYLPLFLFYYYYFFAWQAIAAQATTSAAEDHTEQNRYVISPMTKKQCKYILKISLSVWRYLRIYGSEASALDHLHKIYRWVVCNYNWSFL